MNTEIGVNTDTSAGQVLEPPRVAQFLTLQATLFLHTAGGADRNAQFSLFSLLLIQIFSILTVYVTDKVEFRHCL